MGGCFKSVVKCKKKKLFVTKDNLNINITEPILS